MQVKLWITHNEPWIIAQLGFSTVDHTATTTNNRGYVVGHHLLLAHGYTYRIYKKSYKPAQKGQVGITFNHRVGEPMDPSSLSDIEATERHNQFSLGWFAQPIFGNGDYPDVMKWQVGNKSLEQGRLFNTSTQSRLPEFTGEEKRVLKGSADFFGYNIYSGTKVQGHAQPLTEVGYTGDMDVITWQDPAWPGSGSTWLKITPWAMRNGLNWIRTHYDNPPVYITENGVSDNAGTLDDDFRFNYIRLYSNEMLKAILIDGCDVRGYTAWSFLDNFEWMRGYSERFGLHYVNFSDPNRSRTPKLSANLYSELIQANGFYKNSNHVKTSTIMTSETDIPSTRKSTSHQISSTAGNKTVLPDTSRSSMTSPAWMTTPKAAVVTFNNHDDINSAMGRAISYLSVIPTILALTAHIFVYF